MRRTSVTELLTRRQIVDIPQPETSLRPHLYHPGDIQNMARNRFTDERRTLPPRSFLNLFTVPVPLRPPRVPSRVVPCLRHLALHNIGDIESNTVDLFPSFQNTLSSLSLHRVRLTLDTFIKLLGYFPNLKQLTLHDSAFDPERWATPLPPTHPRGKLTLSALSEEDTDALLWGLRQLEPEYDELNFLEVYGNSIHSIISTCNKTLKRLQLSRRVCKFHTIFKTSRALFNATPWFSSVFHSHSREPPATARTHVPLVTLSPKRSLPHIDHYLHEHQEDCVRPTPPGKSKRSALAVPRHKAVHSGRSIARIGIRTHSRIGVSRPPRVCPRDLERGS